MPRSGRVCEALRTRDYLSIEGKGGGLINITKLLFC